MNWPIPRIFFVVKSRPLPLVAACGLLVELIAFLPVLGVNPSLLVRFEPWHPVCVLTLHVIGSILCGLAFPGWIGLRGKSWAVPANAQTSPAKALQDKPPLGYNVREVGEATTPVSPSETVSPLDRRRPTHRLGPLVCGTSLIFPVLGAVTATIVAIVRRLRSDPYEELIGNYRKLVDLSLPTADLPPDLRETFIERTWNALEMRPFLEIIGSQNLEGESAVSAIESTMALEYPVASRLLRFALASSIPETRYYAAKALSRIEETLDRELREAQEAHQLEPDDPIPTMRIADARLAYGEVGQPDDPLNRFHLLEAISHYRQCLDRVEPQLRSECRARLASACLKVGQFEDAQRHYSELVDMGAATVSVLMGCLEACYRCGQYNRLRHYLAIARVRCPDSEYIREVCRAWPDRKRKA